MNRKAQRRAALAAAKMRMTPQQLADWQSHRKLPKDFPVKSAESEWSSKDQGLRIIDVVERSGVLAHLEPKMTPRRGPKARVSIKALLVCIVMAAYLKTKSYKRSDVVAVMYGLHPEIAQMLGLLDQHGNFKPIKFKRVAYQLLKFEALLWLGWNSGATRCDLRMAFQLHGRGQRPPTHPPTDQGSHRRQHPGQGMGPHHPLPQAIRHRQGRIRATPRTGPREPLTCPNPPR